MQITYFCEITELTKWLFIGAYSLLIFMKTLMAFISSPNNFVFHHFSFNKIVKYIDFKSIFVGNFYYTFPYEHFLFAMVLPKPFLSKF